MNRTTTITEGLHRDSLFLGWEEESAFILGGEMRIALRACITTLFAFPGVLFLPFCLFAFRSVGPSYFGKAALRGEDV